MLSKIHDWFVRYNFEITWFLTGWFSAYFLVDFSQGNWVGCAIDALLVTVNIAFYKK